MAAMFKKRTKKFAQRSKIKSESDDENLSNELSIEPRDEEGSKDSFDISIVKKAEKKKKKDKSGGTTSTTSTVPAALLSFDHDEEGEEDVFRIKKSSHSRKIAKQLKKESKKERDERLKKEHNALEQENKTDKVKKEDESNGTFGGVYNGDDLYSESGSSDEEKKQSHPFRDVLARGEIPNANLIHLARKKRQMAREAGDFIPIDDNVKMENSKSRLIREDDHDVSDDEDKRIDFSVNAAANERKKIHDNFLAAEHGTDSEGSDHEREWEEQQIRKGVSIPQVQPIQSHENYLLQKYEPLPTGGSIGGHQFATSSSGVNQNYNGQMSMSSLTKNLEDLSVDSIKKHLHERLSDLEQVHRAHTNERDTLVNRIEETESSIIKLGSSKGGLEEQYVFFQEMRGYVRDLVECLNEKVPKIDELERSMFFCLKMRADKFVKRRQEDVKDQSTDAMTNKSTVVVMDPTKQRRLTEREARRSRRRRAREPQENRNHYEGLSSDDEENQSDIVKFNTEKDRIMAESSRLLEDVIDEFCVVDFIKSRFEKWKAKYGETYREAYISLCLPKLFTPLIRLQLLDWNPLQTYKKIESMRWYESLLFYGFEPDAETNTDDDDIRLMPNIVEKVLLPKLTALVENVYDPVSTTQTTNLVKLIEQLFDEYPTVNSDNKNTQTLMKAVVRRIHKCLDDDVFLPLYPKPMLENKSGLPNVFLQRQFWFCTKLLGNILSWHSLVDEGILQELALDGLLNRYIMLHLRTADVNGLLIKKFEVVTTPLPRQWFTNLEGDCTLKRLEVLCNCLLTTATVLDRNCMGGKDFDKRELRDKVKQIAEILVNMNAMNHAMTLANMFSLKI